MSSSDHEERKNEGSPISDLDPIVGGKSEFASKGGSEHPSVGSADRRGSASSEGISDRRAESPDGNDRKVQASGQPDHDTKGEGLSTTPKEGATSDEESTQQDETYPQTSEIEVVKEPLPSDIIFGRGKPNHDHPGNRVFRKVVEAYQEEYAASRRYDKLAITQEIITGFEAGRWGTTPARFLKRDYNESASFWTVASDDDIREKVSHALRGKRKSADLDSHGTKKRRKKDSEESDPPNPPVVGSTAAFAASSAPALETRHHVEEQQPVPALSTLQREELTRLIRMGGTPLAMQSSLTQRIQNPVPLGTFSSTFLHGIGSTPSLQQIMGFSPSFMDLRSEVMLRLRAEESFRQQHQQQLQQHVRPPLPTVSDLRLRDALLRPLGSQLLSEGNQALSNYDQAHQDYLLQRMMLHREWHGRQDQQQLPPPQQQQQQQPHRQQQQQQEKEQQQPRQQHR